MNLIRTKMSETIWEKAIETILKIGGAGMPINDTLLELTKNLIVEEEAQFIPVFVKPSMNLEEIKEKSSLDEADIKNKLNSLMKKGIITGTKSRRTGIRVYTLMNFLPGIFEYTFMKGETGPKEKKLAGLFEKLFEQMTIRTQENYDEMKDLSNKIKIPFTRILPVEKTIDFQPETVIPFENVKKVIEKFDDVAVSTCYCRHHKDLIDEHCKINAPKENCLQFGKNAEFAVEYGYAKKISKEKALEILREAADHQLVHKVVLVRGDPNKDEVAICNCCKCCCETFQSYYRGSGPMNSLTSYVAVVSKEDCIGCSTCVDICPAEAQELVESTAKVDENRCIGCGICVHHCPEEAIKLDRTGPRLVIIPPLKLQ
jgi:Pyruvate/2-oxoacid:ferredoxin oxidoreductase delta subunit